MAFYLNNDGIVNARVDLTSAIFIGANVGDYIEFDIEASSGNVKGSYRIAAGYQTGFEALLEVSPTQVLFRPDNAASTAFRTNYSQPSIGQRFTLRVERISSGGWECFIDGSSIGIASNANNFRVIQFGDFDITKNEAFRSKFYRVTASTDGGTSVTNDWNKQTLSGTNDTSFPDTIGGNDGTLINFPTDNSQWVFYSDSTGVTVNASFTVSSPAVAANTSATLTSFSASLSFTVSAPNVSSSASVTLPNPTADAGYTVSAPTFSVSVDASLPQPISDLAFTVSAPAVTAIATATETGFNASVNFTVNAPTFAVDATATLPQPSADVVFTVSAPTFSVVAIVGEIAIIVDDETNINQRVLSTNINAPSLSTNIDAPILSNNING